jgi:hypothetical protein
LNPHIEIDDAVIVHVHFPVVIEVPADPAAGSERRGEIDLAVVVDIDLAIERGVAG